MKQQQAIRFDGPVNQEIPKHAKMIPLLSLLPKDSPLGKNSVGIFVQVNEQVYLARPFDQIPESSTLVRNDAGQICGIPAVTGG